MVNQIRHGEFLLVRIVDKALPHDLHVEQNSTNTSLGIGETGNAHVIELGVDSSIAWLAQAIDDIEAVRRGEAPNYNGDVFVSLQGSATIKHEGPSSGHGDILLPDGLYQVKKMREFDPFKSEVRYVFD